MASRMNTKTVVKNKQAAAMQITAEQILREAFDRQEAEYRPPKQVIQSPEELKEYQLSKRTNFEDVIRRNRYAMNNWLKYAKWETEQKELERARSIYERALNVDHKDNRLWIKYIDMELVAKQINHARNLLNRVVLILPRVDQFWLKWVWLEETVGNFSDCRQIFERWMEWKPLEFAWNTYIKFELRYNEVERVRRIFRLFVECHPQPKTWIRWAKFEAKHGFIENARSVYQQALDFLQDEADESLFISFAKFEEFLKEHDRARVIYKYALDHIPKHRASLLYQTFVSFEKQFGDRDAIEDVIVNKRRFQYEEEIKLNASNYDVWFDYLHLEQQAAKDKAEHNKSKGKTSGRIADEDKAIIREVFERAIANVPPSKEKRYWRRYIYLWINYALFEELDAQDVDRARMVYQTVLKLVPHSAFSFSKLWILAANFEVRQMDLEKARLVFGNAIGRCPKDKIFLSYIDLETKLGNVDRCRTLFTRWIEVSPYNCQAWTKFADLENDLDEPDRARAIYELSIQQPELDMPELVWKNFIDFEIENQQYDRVRALYSQLLDRTQHVKVWISFAQFEEMIEDYDRARSVFSKAFSALRLASDKQERVALFEAWKAFEESLYQETKKKDFLDEVLAKAPEKIKRRRRVINDDGSEGGWEEFFEYVFPDENSSSSKPNLKILERARAWKRQKTSHDDPDDSSPSPSSSSSTFESVSDRPAPSAPHSISFVPASAPSDDRPLSDDQ